MGDNNKLVRFESEIRPLAGGDILHAPADSLTLQEAVEAYAIVKFLADRVETRRQEIRERLLSDDELIETGQPTKSGGSKTRVNGNKVTRKRTLRRFADVSRIRQVLAEKGLEESEVFDEKIETKVTKVVNPSKLSRLVELGKLSDKDLESFHKEVWSLTVDASEDLEEILEIADQRASMRRQLLDFNADTDD